MTSTTTNNVNSQQNITSEGFDLDAIPSSSQSDNHEEVIYEIGGGATGITSSSQVNPSSPSSNNTNTNAKANHNNNEKIKEEDEEEEKSPIYESEEFKKQGNEFFKKGDYLNAYDSYSDAIDACPPTEGEEGMNYDTDGIMKLKTEHEEKEREKANQRYSRDTDRRRLVEKQKEKDDHNNSDDGNGGNHDTTTESNKQENVDDDGDELKPTEFQLPPHEYGTQLAVYYSNRAACLLHETRYTEAIQDCDIAILLNPTYTKAYIRRMTAYENTEQTETALSDAKTASTLEPHNKQVQKHVTRLQKLEDERMENLKEETMGKLKDLGNSILGNFGLSMDNFKAQQDPNTGSYNISFQN
jgi:tetratricopeptide (TPR) repeat protein